jgi:hypothetical protein
LRIYQQAGFHPKISTNFTPLKHKRLFASALSGITLAKHRLHAVHPLGFAGGQPQAGFLDATEFPSAGDGLGGKGASCDAQCGESKRFRGAGLWDFQIRNKAARYCVVPSLHGAKLSTGIYAQDLVGA